MHRPRPSDDDLQGTPFICIAAQGETAVDKVRRAEVLFSSLLDILSRLDSKASEGLEFPSALIQDAQNWCNPTTVSSGGSV
ncbi:hypothetical protein NCS55_01424300 [Fusarium keratoplasticum]|nr:hypothetical protein NCS55_01424300 [Fusarium keratoplasticum]